MPVYTDSARKLAQASDPAPSSIVRGPLARLHWRHAVATDDALVAVVADEAKSGEWSAVLAETHARLLDPAGVQPLPRPSPVGAAVGAALESHPSWVSLCDAAALHPGVARDAVVGLADVVGAALLKAGTANVDTRRSLADLDAARARLDAARAAQHEVTTSEENREALREGVAAGQAVEQASAAAQAADSAGVRVRAHLDAAGSAIGSVIAKATERAEAIRACVVAGLGEAMGAADPAAFPDDLVEMLTPEIAKMMRQVGALRLALREGRSARHLPGREGVKGPDVGGLDRVGDLLPLARAALAGVLGPEAASLERLRLVQGRSAVVEKGGGKANDGHVVVVLDKSGSMRAHGKEEWAAALALAVILETRAQHRTAALVTYDGAVRASIVIDGPVAMREAFAAVCKRSGGDGDIDAALKAAGECLARMPQGGDKADVLMLTDGEWTAACLDGATIDPKRLRACFIGGSIPPSAVFASAWEIRSVEGADANTLAVTIARTVV